MKKKTLSQQDTSKSQSGSKEIIVETHRGILVILKNRCKSCGLCIAFCPKKIIELSGELNNKGYKLPVIKRPQDCIGCNVCVLFCPDLALFFNKKSENETTDKHR